MMFQVLNNYGRISGVRVKRGNGKTETEKRKKG